MKKIIYSFGIIFILFSISVSAQNPENFEAAKSLAAKIGKPILLEFVHEDCEFCHKAQNDAESEQILIDALKQVVHLPLNVNEGEGDTLSEVYEVGIVYPVFILADSQGYPINRWVGYTGGAKALVSTLNKALEDLTNIDDREARYKNNPNIGDGLFLAGYYSETGDNLKAIGFYRDAIKLGATGSGQDYSYRIFENIANAVWDDEMAFDEVLPAADAVLNSKNRNIKDIIDVARLMTRLADKNKRTDVLEKYLKAGIEASSGVNNQRVKDMNNDLRADYAIYIDKDVNKGIEIKKEGMPSGWEDTRDLFYMFAKWCLIRKINLDEAEMYARKTLNQVQPGHFRARAYNTLAEILEANDKINEAIGATKAAIEHDPENEYYQTELERLQSLKK